MNCPKCGVEMFELTGWDFLHCVCFNPVHKVPVHLNQTWCHEATVTERGLTDYEQKVIDDRKSNLMKGLAVVQTNWELIGEVHGFMSGGFNPEIRKRIGATFKE